MLHIKPISDSRYYNNNNVLKDRVGGHPIFPTKNGGKTYVIIDIEEYYNQEDLIKLLSKLNKTTKVTFKI